MSAQERLADALLLVDEIHPESLARLVWADGAFADVARALTVADEWLAQDMEDGRALRLLRDALPSGTQCDITLTGQVPGAEVMIRERRRAYGARGQWATANTVAGACRAALEARA